MTRTDTAWCSGQSVRARETPRWDAIGTPLWYYTVRCRCEGLGCGGKGYGAGLGGSETGEGWRAVLWHSSPDMGCDGIECRGGGAEVWYGGWYG